MKKSKKQKRYSYSTVGYGVFSLIGEIYRMGRIEVFDNEDESPYASSEGNYCLPYDVANSFEHWIESIKTDFPIQFSIGSVNECSIAVSEHLKIPAEKINDLETKKEFYKQKYKK
jgi:hypothetical protein